MYNQEVTLIFDPIAQQPVRNIFEGFPQPEHESDRHETVLEQNSWIDEYLNPEVLSKSHSDDHYHGVSESLLPENNSAPTTSKKEVDEEVEQEVQQSKRSIFHNIQKNLITFLKKVHIRRIDLVNKPSGLRAYDLWKIFLADRIYTKKSLYMIFGVAQQQNEQHMKKIAASNSEFKKLVEKYPMEEIERAQALLRERFFFEISDMSKEHIHEISKVTNFEDFYTYLQSFLEELEGEGLVVRMKKDKKKRIFDHRLASTESMDHSY